MYNKLFTKILDSSIWLEDAHVRLVWITLLAVKDQDEIAHLSSIGNVALRARVTEEQAADAIHCLESPDTKNPDQDNEGRRIERLPGIGWHILNGRKYTEIVKAEQAREQTRERVKRFRERGAKRDSNAPVTQVYGNVTTSDTDTERDIPTLYAGVRESEAREPPDPKAVAREGPAMAAYREFFPDASVSCYLTDLVDQRATDIVRWRRTLDYWRSNRYRANSVGKMLDHYDEQGAKQNGKISNKPSAAKGGDNGHRESAADVARRLGARPVG